MLETWSKTLNFYEISNSVYLDKDESAKKASKLTTKPTTVTTTTTTTTTTSTTTTTTTKSTTPAVELRPYRTEAPASQMLPLYVSKSSHQKANYAVDNDENGSTLNGDLIIPNNVKNKESVFSFKSLIHQRGSSLSSSSGSSRPFRRTSTTTVTTTIRAVYTKTVNDNIFILEPDSLDYSDLISQLMATSSTAKQRKQKNSNSEDVDAAGEASEVGDDDVSSDNLISASRTNFALPATLFYFVSIVQFFILMLLL